MTKINQFFVKNADIAFFIDVNAIKTKKFYYNCPCCEPIATWDGYLINTRFSRRELKDIGILVSSTSSYFPGS